MEGGATFRAARNGFLLALSRSGYSVEVREDLEFWLDWLYSQADAGTPNHTFNPAINSLDASTAFWIAVRYVGQDSALSAANFKGICAVIACRLFVTDDYVELIRNGRLWYPQGHMYGISDVCGPNATTRLRGRIGHHGGCYIVRKHRGRGLPVVLTRLTRTVSGGRWLPNWHAGMIKQDPPPANDLARKYGYTHQLPCIRGYSAGRRANAKVDMTLISMADMLNQARRDEMLLRLHRRNDLRDTAAALVQRTQQPQICLGETIENAYHAA